MPALSLKDLQDRLPPFIAPTEEELAGLLVLVLTLWKQFYPTKSLATEVTKVVKAWTP